MNELPPIPIPAAQRWREFRVRFLPLVAFAGAVASALMLWKHQMPVPTIVGEVETTSARLTSPKSGVLANFSLSSFQRVKKGDPLAQVITTAPRVLQSSLAVILAEIQLLRVNLQPIIGDQRYALTYERVRLDWMEHRVQLASTRTRLDLAENDLRRTEQLYREKIVSEVVLEQARSLRDRLAVEVEERGRLVAEQQQTIDALRLNTEPASTNQVSVQAILQASINVQEEKLRLTEADLSPITLPAPIDGVVSAILRRSCEAVMAGEPIATITAMTSDKIVAYVRQPSSIEPQTGMTVEVRTRSFPPAVGEARILQVGSQIEPIGAHLSPFPSNGRPQERGQPILVSKPASLKLLPGDLIDGRLLPQPE